MIGATANPNVAPAAIMSSVRGKTTKAANKNTEQSAATETGVKSPKW